ncbi:MAG: tetratricopeptide repeat protein [Novipirellula sp. JB048]
MPLRICVVAFVSGVLWTSLFAKEAHTLRGAPLRSDPAEPTSAQLAMLEMMQQRVAKTPAHSDAWRSLGRLQNTLGDPTAALASTRRAIEHDPFNAAAQFDQGQLLIAAGHPDQARRHFDRVFEIAPESGYAAQLKQQGVVAPVATAAVLGTPEMGAPEVSPLAIAHHDAHHDALGTFAPGLDSPSFGLDTQVKPASYPIQTFDGADDFEQRFEQLEREVDAPLHRLRVFFETGVLYNSNVTLTPISRELAQSDSTSFQAFANPDLDWKWIRTETMRLGAMFRGYFTANESTFQEFNLASFQPGAFFERDFQLADNEAIGRLEYLFANDFFDGQRIGDRHSATASLTLIRPDLDAIYGYLRVAQTDFRDDGPDPQETSLDGTTVTFGLSRFFQTGWDRLPMHSLGVDLESADTEGANYRYRSIHLHGSTGWEIRDRWKFIPTWGVGLRDYTDFVGPVSRDEFFWRLHGRLQYTVTDSLAVAVVAGHDRFASDHPDFDTERTEGGVVLTFTR